MGFPSKYFFTLSMAKRINLLLVSIRGAEAEGCPDEGNIRFQSGFVIALGVADVDHVIRGNAIALHQLPDGLALAGAGIAEAQMILDVCLQVV